MSAEEDDRLSELPERDWEPTEAWTTLDDLEDFNLLFTGRWMVYFGRNPMAHHEDCQHATMAEGSDVWEPHTNSRMLKEWRAEMARRKQRPAKIKLAWCSHCSCFPKS
jgi:hypothetical protein